MPFVGGSQGGIGLEDLVGVGAMVCDQEGDGAPLAQCRRSAAIWASGRIRHPYCVILGASLWFENGFLMLLLH